eukprot:COSAG03_NODE_6477_length_1054_cov_4.852356_2_plen_99_part_00
MPLHEQVLGTDLLDIQQAEHAYSGCDIALWDALGKHTGRPVYELLHEYRLCSVSLLAADRFGSVLFCALIEVLNGSLEQWSVFVLECCTAGGLSVQVL